MTDYQVPNQPHSYQPPVGGTVPGTTPPLDPSPAPTQAPTTTQSSPQEASTPQKPVKLIVLGGLVMLLLLAGILLFSRSNRQSTSLSDLSTTEPTDFTEVVVVNDGNEPVEQPLPPMPAELSQALPTQTEIAVISNADTVAVGQPVTLQVVASSEQTVDGIEFVLTYDPTFLSNVTVTKGSAFTTYIRQEVNSESGRVSVTMIANPGENITLSPNTVLATITGTAALSGEAIFSFDQNRTIVAAGGGQNILKNTKGFALMIQ
jgi:hypothetical protein